MHFLFPNSVYLEAVSLISCLWTLYGLLEKKHLKIGEVFMVLKKKKVDYIKGSILCRFDVPRENFHASIFDDLRLDV